jgi:hypothetical protein
MKKMAVVLTLVIISCDFNFFTESVATEKTETVTDTTGVPAGLISVTGERAKVYTRIHERYLDPEFKYEFSEIPILTTAKLTLNDVYFSSGRTSGIAIVSTPASYINSNNASINSFTTTVSSRLLISESFSDKDVLLPLEGTYQNLDNTIIKTSNYEDIILTGQIAIYFFNSYDYTDISEIERIYFIEKNTFINEWKYIYTIIKVAVKNIEINDIIVNSIVKSYVQSGNEVLFTLDNIIYSGEVAYIETEKGIITVVIE